MLPRLQFLALALVLAPAVHAQTTIPSELSEASRACVTFESAQPTPTGQPGP